MAKKDEGSHYHNKGQEDASKGKYDPPGGNSIFIDLGNVLFGKPDSQIKADKEYDEGWRNTKDQKK